MTTPPPYPRVPHLVGDRADPGDTVLDRATLGAVLQEPVLVEEKLDGANVMVWAEGGGLQCSLRSGPGSRDRAGQLGPLRAWLAGRGAGIGAGLDDGVVLYGEWVWFTHTVAYDRLPSPLVGFDVWREDTGFAVPDERNVVLRDTVVSIPRELFRGVVGALERLESMVGPAAWGPGPMEGVVVRTLDGSPPRVSKLVRPGWRVIGDDEWARGRPRNTVSTGGSGGSQ